MLFVMGDTCVPVILNFFFVSHLSHRMGRALLRTCIGGAGMRLLLAGQRRWNGRESQGCPATCACCVPICSIGIQLKGLVGPGVNRRCSVTQYGLLLFKWR